MANPNEIKFGAAYFVKSIFENEIFNSEKASHNFPFAYIILKQICINCISSFQTLMNEWLNECKIDD